MTGPLEVFTGANTWQANHGDGACLRHPGGTASLFGGPTSVRTSSGLRVTLPDEDLREFRPPPPGPAHRARGRGITPARPRTDRLAPRARPPGRPPGLGVHGRPLLAGAGLLDGRRVTTPLGLPQLAVVARYPQVSVEEDPIFVRDGNAATSAGVTAGIDLALALVEDDLGRDAALDIARHLVVSPAPTAGQPGPVQRHSRPGSWPTGKCSARCSGGSRTTRARTWSGGDVGFARPACPLGSSPGRSRPRWARRRAGYVDRVRVGRRPGVVWSDTADGS